MSHREGGLKLHAEEQTLNYFLAVAGKYSELFPHLDCTVARLTAPEKQQQKTSSAYAGNNFSWPCNSLDLCHNSLTLFCNSVHFFTIAVHFLNIHSWLYYSYQLEIWERKHSQTQSTIPAAVFPPLQQWILRTYCDFTVPHKTKMGLHIKLQTKLKVNFWELYNYYKKWQNLNIFKSIFSLSTHLQSFGSLPLEAASAYTETAITTRI